MVDKELRRLKRRDLLHMLLTQCQETERLQQENGEMLQELTELRETLERLKGKLNIKDERLNQKDARIRELQAEIEEMKASKAIELEDAGNIAEAALRLNGIFEAAQRSAEQYLMNVRRFAQKEEAPLVIHSSDRQAIPIKALEKKPTETGWRPGIVRKKSAPVRIKREAQLVLSQAETDTDRGMNQMSQRYAASGDIHG